MVMLRKLNFNYALESYLLCFFPNFMSTDMEEKVWRENEENEAF